MSTPDKDQRMTMMRDALKDGYQGDGVVTLRSRTDLVFCSSGDIHGQINDEDNIDFDAAVRQADTAGCGPHTLDPLHYPFPGAALSVATADGSWGIGCLYEDMDSFEAALRERLPMPWAIMLPDGYVFKTTCDPKVIQAMFVAFTGLKTFGDPVRTVDQAYEQIARERINEQRSIDPGDQQL